MGSWTKPVERKGPSLVPPGVMKEVWGKLGFLGFFPDVLEENLLAPCSTPPRRNEKLLSFSQLFSVAFWDQW